MACADTGADTTQTRRTIYQLWRDINKLEPGTVLRQVRSKSIGLHIDRYLLVNSRSNPRNLSTQMTGNTCYFQ